jgi:hypothetical protein
MLKYDSNVELLMGLIKYLFRMLNGEIEYLSGIFLLKTYK